MNQYNSLARIISLAIFLSVSFVTKAQISSVSDAEVPTEYSSGTQDKIFVFCGNRDERNGNLTATEPSGETASFEWTMFNTQTGKFDIPKGLESGSPTSTISGLADGGYRVKITSVSGEKQYTAWVFNNYIEAKAEIPESDCNSFLLKGILGSPSVLTYTDLSTGQPKVLAKNIQIEWKDGETTVTRNQIEYRNYEPPTKDTDYSLIVTDRFGCSLETTVSYRSIVTKASFTLIYEDQGKYNSPSQLEAPLKVTFLNTSENGDPGRFEWFVYKTVEFGKDSLVDNFFNDTPPSYTFEETGTYKMKLVSKHDACTDTISEFTRGDGIENEIVITESFIDAPNVFTPGTTPGQNDVFAINFRSMKSLKVTIFNRWGRLVHKWEKNNVAGFSNTVTESVWDGKIGGRIASSGVYYYVVEGVGRDGKRRAANGFVHLFTEK